MKPPLSGHSLRFKLTVGTLLPLTVILALSSYLQYLRHRDRMLVEVQRSAADAARIVETSLRHAMMTNDKVLINQTVSQIASQRGVRHLFILDKEGRIAISPVPRDVGVVLDIKDRTCQACHEHRQARQSASLVITDETGHRVLRSVNSIVKRPRCQKCHPRDDPTYGVLIMDFSMEGVQKQLAGEQRSTFVWSLGALALLGATINTTMRRMIVGPLERLTEAVRRVGQGELSHRVRLKGNDEVGELSQAFDRMAEGLEGKASLERQVRERTEALRVERDKLAALNTIASTVSHSLRLEEVMESALDVVLDMLGLQAGWIFLFDQGAESNRLVVSRGVSDAFAKEEASRPPDACVSRIVRETAACAIQDISHCRRLSPEAIRAEGLTSHACIPLVAKGQVLGVLNLASSGEEHAGCFTGDRLQLLTAIGQQVGIAIENAGLYEELQRKEALRRQLIEQLWTVQEDERRRIARELHDHTGQALTSLLVGLKMLAETDSPSEVRKQVGPLRETAAQTLDDVHDLAMQLRPSVLDDMGLVAATQHMATTFASHFGIRVHFQAVGFETRRLPPAVETAAYRIVQEALTNVARHAQAGNVDILLECRRNAVLALVEDDGGGFDVEAALRDRVSGHLGLFGMQERAALVDGRLTVEASADGTTVLVEIPLAADQVENHGAQPAGPPAEDD